MGEMPFKIKRASSVPISVVIDTGVNSNAILPLIIQQWGMIQRITPPTFRAIIKLFCLTEDSSYSSAQLPELKYCVKVLMSSAGSHRLLQVRSDRN